jgi:hypothetical protein
MRLRATLVALGATAALAAAPAATAPAKDWEPECHAATAITERPHGLVFRVSCNFEMTDVDVQPAKPAAVRAVRHNPRIRNPDPEDHFRCWRHDNRARCKGRAGSGARLRGVLRMDGDRCATATDVHVFGGVDCDNPDYACPRVGYAGHMRDPKPSGCG